MHLIRRLTLVVCVTFSCVLPALHAYAEGALKVGVIAPLTGGVATWGVSVRTAIELANQSSAQPAELYFQDEETCSPTKALTAYTFLRDVQKVDLIIASCLEGARAVAPLARRDHLPLLISGRSSREFQRDNPNALSWLALLDNEGIAVADLVEKEKLTRGTAMVWSGYFGVQFSEGIKSALEKKKSAFHFSSIQVAQGENPGLTEVQNVLRNKPEVIFLMLSEPAALFVLRALRQFGYSGKIVIQSSMLQTYDPTVRAGFRGVLQQKFPVQREQFLKLQTRLRAQMGDTVADDFIFSYDGFRVLGEAASRCSQFATVDRAPFEACLTNELRTERWREGVSGPFRFLHDGSTERPMFFARITDDGYEIEK